MAVKLQAVDRWPIVVSDPRIWDRGGFPEAFAFRWHDRPVPPGVQRRFETLDRIEHLDMMQALRRWRDRHIFRQRRQRGLDLADVNAGPGGRTSNSYPCALAADAHLAGTPASAISWNDHNDPLRLSPPENQLRTLGRVARPRDAADLRRLIESWGPGAKGLVSVRDPEHAFHRVLNAHNVDGQAKFAEYTRASIVSLSGRITDGVDGEEAAADLISLIDPRNPFGSVVVWRTPNIPNASRLPDDIVELADSVELAPERVATHVRAALPLSVPLSVVEATAARIILFSDLAYAHWLIERVRRGACTLLPTDLQRLAAGERIEPLTPIDTALDSLAARGSLRIVAWQLEVTADDTPEARSLAEVFIGAEARTGEVNGLAPGTFELWIDDEVLDRRREDSPEWFDLAVPPAPDQPVAARGFSWLDVNRAFSIGERKTNCWNCAAAVAEWLLHRNASMGLPVYPDAPYRPRIPDFLATMGTVGATCFVTTKAQADVVVAGWGPSTHGLVVAAYSEMSTHIFNVFVDAAGAIRYLDGHTGREGDYNFDTDWVRIGIVQLTGTPICDRASLDGASSDRRPALAAATL